MRRVIAIAAFVVLSGALLGCYHATVETELQPSAQTIDVPWASAWIYGLVQPKTVETAEECSNGVARVETELSFVNQLVGLLTLGIYTPMHIKVTCAAGGSASAADDGFQVGVDSNATAEEKREAMAKAVYLSAETAGPVFVVFE